ncbi:inorganic phosphate transporter family protein [Candidatus Bipolaricaulota bacterium]|nr:inorganic phosphate transporter family protein [Candidatus Bipolaricaulota bacterium]
MWELTVLFIAGAYVGWNIGANDAGNCIGTTVGSGLLSYRKAIILVGVFVILGALLQGHGVLETIGRGVVTTEMPVVAILTALFASGLFVTLATFFKLPVSTSQAIVGGIAGVGLATGAEVDLSTVLTIAQVWVICPILTGIIAFLLYHLVAFPLRRIRNSERVDRILKILLIGSSCYVAFALGANNLGNAVGPIANLGIDSIWLNVMGAVALALGALTFGHRVAETVGGGITALDPLSAFAAQASAAVAIHFFSLLAIPVSTSQAVVGALVGVGLVKGMRAVNRRKVIEIVAGWVATPLTAGLFSFGLYRLIMLVW